jgi:hypothetical protein
VATKAKNSISEEGSDNIGGLVGNPEARKAVRKLLGLVPIRQIEDTIGDEAA